MNAGYVDFAAILASAKRNREEAKKTEPTAIPAAPIVKSVTMTCKPQPKTATTAKKLEGSKQEVSGAKQVVRQHTREECLRFIVAMRDATSNEERIAVLQGFEGYDNSLPLGLQIDKATLTAIGMIHPVICKPYIRGCQATLAGWVAGMPDFTTKKRDDLLARLELARHELAEAEYLGDKERVRRERNVIRGMQKEIDNLAESY
jgi:hypothetical protein